MSEGFITRYFARIGSSYYQGEDFKKQFASVKQNKIIGKFGIGLLACFMLTDRIIIETKSVLNDAWRLELKSDLTRILATRIKKDDNGTTVTLELRNDIDMDVLQQVKYYVIHSDPKIGVNIDGTTNIIVNKWLSGVQFMKIRERNIVPMGETLLSGINESKIKEEKFFVNTEQIKAYVSFPLKSYKEIELPSAYSDYVTTMTEGPMDDYDYIHKNELRISKNGMLVEELTSFPFLDHVGIGVSIDIDIFDDMLLIDLSRSHIQNIEHLETYIVQLRLKILDRFRKYLNRALTRNREEYTEHCGEFIRKCFVFPKSTHGIHSYTMDSHRSNTIKPRTQLHLEVKIFLRNYLLFLVKTPKSIEFKSVNTITNGFLVVSVPDIDLKELMSVVKNLDAIHNLVFCYEEVEEIIKHLDFALPKLLYKDIFHYSPANHDLLVTVLKHGKSYECNFKFVRFINLKTDKFIITVQFEKSELKQELLVNVDSSLYKNILNYFGQDSNIHQNLFETLAKDGVASFKSLIQTYCKSICQNETVIEVLDDHITSSLQDGVEKFIQPDMWYTD